MKLSSSSLLLLSALALSAPLASLADEVKISGASTVNAFITPMVGGVEKDSGHKLNINPTNTGKGIVDLMNGSVDMAMTSEPIDIALAAAKAAGAEVKASDVKIHQIAEQEIVFGVHPSNTVGKLTWAQIRDIHVGKIKNWKEVGGPDKAIVVYSDAKTGGTRAMVKKVVLKGEEYGADVKDQANVKTACEMVAGDPAGFTGAGISFAQDAKLKLVETTKLMRPLGFLTKGEPNAKAARVISSFKSAAKK
jgi:phosphate transport system substrate-binding protein